MPSKKPSGRQPGKPRGKIPPTTRAEEISPAVPSCPQPPGEPSTPRDPATNLRNLLIDRLNAVTVQHDDDGRKAIEADRSIFRLMVQVKTWAAALVDACHDACHSRAADYAEIHGNAIERALLCALMQHLGLPTDQNPFSEPWPESNGVSEFVLEIADAPVDWTADRPTIMSYRLLRERRLPRWQRKGPEGRATFARRPEENTPFLSVEETEKVLRDLEESFRNVLIKRSQSWSDEVDLARRRSERAAEQARAVESNTSSEQNNKEIAGIREVAPGVGLPLVDLRRPARTIAEETARAALAKGAPYRDVPNLAHILKAVEHKKKTGCSYREASIQEFGDPTWEHKIRYWHNKHARGEQ